jgi:hypothetical protein
MLTQCFLIGEVPMPTFFSRPAGTDISPYVVRDRITISSLRTAIILHHGHTLRPKCHQFPTYGDHLRVLPRAEQHVQQPEQPPIEHPQDDLPCFLSLTMDLTASPTIPATISNTTIVPRFISVFSFSVTPGHRPNASRAHL